MRAVVARIAGLDDAAVVAVDAAVTAVVSAMTDDTISTTALHYELEMLDRACEQRGGGFASLAPSAQELTLRELEDGAIPAGSVLGSSWLHRVVETVMEHRLGRYRLGDVIPDAWQRMRFAQ